MTTAVTDLQTPVQTYMQAPSRPRFALPENTCDTHVHVFGPVSEFSYAPVRSFTPADAGKDRLFALHRHLGVTRCVIVQSACHGHDNAVVEDAIAAGAGNYLGVALVPVDVGRAELARLAGAGFRAVRFNFMKHLGTGTPVEEVVALTPVLADLGMHLQIHFESALVHTLGPVLRQSACEVVIDHMGRVDAREGVEGRDFQGLLRLVEDSRFYVKVSGIDRIDAAPPYTQGVALARALVNHIPDRVLWGTDWPHPNHTHIPDDGALVDALAGFTSDPRHLQALLVDNPARLYRF